MFSRDGRLFRQTLETHFFGRQGRDGVRVGGFHGDFGTRQTTMGSVGIDVVYWAARNRWEQPLDGRELARAITLVFFGSVSIRFLR